MEIGRVDRCDVETDGGVAKWPARRAPSRMSDQELLDALGERRRPTPHNGLGAYGLSRAAYYVVHWYARPEWESFWRIRIITPFDAQDRIDGRERYFYEGLTSEGGIVFCHGRVTEMTKQPFADSLRANTLYTLDQLHGINLANAAHCLQRCRAAVASPEYSDLMSVEERSVARFLWTCSSPMMRRLPWELRRHIFGWVWPAVVWERRQSLFKCALFGRGGGSRSWIESI